jgi:hypothetical protein
VPVGAVTGAFTEPLDLTKIESPGAFKPGSPTLADGACDWHTRQLNTWFEVAGTWLGFTIVIVWGSDVAFTHCAVPPE